MSAPLLVIGIGNPSRGDDALGPLFVERLEREPLPEVEVLTDFQLQIEHAMDLVGRSRVVFVDASLQAGVRLEHVEPCADAAAQTHALSPAAVLEVFRQVVGPPPEAYILSIGGESFELGEGLSASAARNLEDAFATFVRLVTSDSPNGSTLVT